MSPGPAASGGFAHRCRQLDVPLKIIRFAPQYLFEIRYGCIRLTESLSGHAAGEQRLEVDRIVIQYGLRVGFGRGGILGRQVDSGQCVLNADAFIFGGSGVDARPFLSRSTASWGRLVFRYNSPRANRSRAPDHPLRCPGSGCPAHDRSVFFQVGVGHSDASGRVRGIILNVRLRIRSDLPVSPVSSKAGQGRWRGPDS
jgi:hypothetical protein